jgi:hypothetical protein
MKDRVITRKRGVIPGCRAAGPDSHMAVETLGRSWAEVAELPSAVDVWLVELTKKSGSQQSGTAASRRRTT